MNAPLDSDPPPDYCSPTYSPVAGWGSTTHIGNAQIIIPHAIREDGEMNIDTLKIPLYKTGVEILHARDSLYEDCASFTIGHPYASCDFEKDAPDANDAEGMAIMKARRAHLGMALAISLRCGSISDKSLERFVLLQTAIDDEMSQVAALEMKWKEYYFCHDRAESEAKKKVEHDSIRRENLNKFGTDFGLGKYAPDKYWENYCRNYRKGRH